MESLVAYEEDEVDQTKDKESKEDAQEEPKQIVTAPVKEDEPEPGNEQKEPISQGTTQGECAADEYVWEYLDYAGSPHGPFTAEEIKGWIISGYFSPMLYIRKRSEDHYGLLQERSEFAETWRMFFQTQAALFSQAMQASQAYYAAGQKRPNDSDAVSTGAVESQAFTNTAGSGPLRPPQDVSSHIQPSSAPASSKRQQDEEEEYAQVAHFNIRTGRFQANTPQQHWQKKGIPQTREERQLNHYFDMDAWKEQMKARKEKEAQSKKKRK